jgi:hypothetical protein
VADGRPAGQPREPRLVEDVGDVAHLTLDADLAVLERRDAGRLLPAVLQGIEAEVGDVGGVLRVADAEDAALVFESAGKFHPLRILASVTRISSTRV